MFILFRFDRLDTKLTCEMDAIKNRAISIEKSKEKKINQDFSHYLKRGERYNQMLEDIGKAIDEKKKISVATSEKPLLPLSSDEENNEVFFSPPLNFEGVRDIDGLVGSVIARAATQIQREDVDRIKKSQS